MTSGKKASPVDTQGSRMGGGGPPDDGVQWGRAGFWRLLEAEMRPPQATGSIEVPAQGAALGGLG